MNIPKLQFFLDVMPRLAPFVCLFACMLPVSCASTSLTYTEIELQRSQTVPDLRFIRFSNQKGRQLAFYVPPHKTPNKLPDRIVIVFPGIGSKALDRLDWAEAINDAGAGILLIDYPGRGECEGVMRPKHLPWTTDGALSALAGELNVSPQQFEGRFLVLAHSFGCAAALQFCEKHRAKRIVLLAPFPTLRRAMFRRLGPLAWIIPDNLDNREALRNILSNSPQTWITIIHGSLDESIPVRWGRDLAAINSDRIVMNEVPNGTHTSILTENLETILNALFR
jgi:pimeloyl-ACP methyl ester carboxylesterase